MKLFCVGRYLYQDKNEERLEKGLAINEQPWRCVGYFEHINDAIESMKDNTFFMWESETNVNYNLNSRDVKVYYKEELIKE